MFAYTHKLLDQARSEGYAVGAFNIYNMEGALAVVQTAQELRSPVILQVLPNALILGGKTLVSLCLEAAQSVQVPVAVHLDHCSARDTIYYALDCGFSSVMADGSGLSYDDNIAFTREIVTVSKSRFKNGAVEAELGQLSGEEDGLAIDVREACMTSPDQVSDFVEKTNIDALAVCIGNVHGTYATTPDLDFDRLTAIANQVSIPLVLHGTSGLPDEMITKSIELGICKFNVNTEVRKEYIKTLKNSFETSNKVELIDLMTQSIKAMREPIRSKMNLFCSKNRAKC